MFIGRNCSPKNENSVCDLLFCMEHKRRCLLWFIVFRGFKNNNAPKMFINMNIQNHSLSYNCVKNSLKLNYCQKKTFTLLYWTFNCTCIQSNMNVSNITLQWFSCTDKYNITKLQIKWGLTVVYSGRDM